MGQGITPVIQWNAPAGPRPTVLAASITAVFDQLMAGAARCAAAR